MKYGDLISRQEVCDWLEWYMNDAFKRGYEPSVFYAFVYIRQELQPAQPEIIYCNQCKYYQGGHGCPGHAPCDYWHSGGVMWNWFCSRAERRTDE